MLRPSIGLFLSPVLVLVTLTSLNAHPAQKSIKGKTFYVEKNTVMGSQLKNSNQMRRAPLPCPSPLPNLPLNGSTPLPNPDALSGAFFPNPSTSNLLTAPPQTVGLTFVASQQGIDPEFSVTPIDTSGVVGLTQFVVGGRTGLVSFTKSETRDGVLDSENATFANLDGDFSLFIAGRGSRIQYDRLANRFVSVQLNGDVNTGINGDLFGGGITVAVSDSGTLSNNTVWTVFTIYDMTAAPDSNGCAGDVNPSGVLFSFPTVGIDQNAVYLSTSVYLKSNGAWVTNNLLVLQKSSLYNASGPVLVTAFPEVTLSSSGGFVGDQQNYRATSTLVPLDNFDDPKPAFGYAISQDPEFFGLLRVYRIVNAGSTAPTLAGPFSVNVMQTTSSKTNPLLYPPFNGQLFGSLGALEYVDDRLAISSHINKKQIYTAHAVFVDATGIATQAAGGRLGIRWYEIDVTGDATGQGLGTETATTVPALVQAGTLFDPAVTNPLSYNFPSIASNSSGALSIAGTVSGAAQNIAAFYVGKSGSDPKDGTLRIGASQPNVYATGSGSFTRSLGAGRAVATSVAPIGQLFGETSYSSLDPIDKTTIWTIQEIAVNGLQTMVVAQLLAS